MRLFILICFICLTSSAICCNQYWFRYNHKCYRAISFSYDFRMARRYCQIFKGDLATIKNNETLQIVASTFPPNNSSNSYWVNENSTISESATASACNYVYGNEKVELAADGDCNDFKYFICEVSEETDFECPTSWNFYGGTCYKTFNAAADYNHAKSFCSIQLAQLAVLDDIAKEHNAAAVIIGQKEVFLVAVEAIEGDYRWTNGNKFQPSCSECRNNTPGNCIGFSSDPQHPTMFTWVNLDCNTTNAYLCEMSPQAKTTTPTTTVTEPTTTLPPLQCPIGYNWKPHQDSGFCFWETTYETERLNWFQARKFCQVYGGDLATYKNSGQEEHGLGGAKGHYRGLWFGLKRDERDDVFHWVDNSTVSYTNWYYNEPKLKSRSKFCVMHGSSNSQWELDYCGVRRWFVCKAPKSREPRLPNIDLFKKTNCNISGPSIYRNHWFLYDNHCYLVREADKYSWDTGRYFCQDNGGHMVSIHSFQETDFILQAISTSVNANFWIGLSARGIDSSMSWTDGTPLDFLYWQDDYNATENVDKCVTFDKQRGFWQVEHCNSFLGVICKRGVNASYDFATPEPTVLLPGNCEKSWFRFGNKCFKTFGEKWSQKVEWNTAAKKCEEVGATLISIHNSEEQDFVTDLMIDIKKDAWIGLKSSNKGSVFTWNDDSPLDYTNWNSNEPKYSLSVDDNLEYEFRLTTAQEMCIELSYDAVSMGKWNNALCHRTKAYICQKNPNPTITEPSEDFFACPNVTDWSRLGDSCFKIFEEKGDELDWMSAQKKCKALNSNLVVYRSSDFAVFLKKRLKRKDEFFWIGTRETKANTYNSIARPTSYTNWLSGQPTRISEVDNCVSMDKEGKWIVKNCKEKHPFICELSKEEEKSLPSVEDSSKHCPSDSAWKDLGGDQCYYFGFRKVNWNNAMFLCYKHGGHLASFHSLQEMKLVQDYLVMHADSETSYHIGLGKKYDGSYGWLDHSPLDFTFWEKETPVSIMNCVQIHPRTVKWRPVDCEDMLRNFICSVTKSGKSNRNSIESDSRKDDEILRNIDDTEYQLGTGGIIGILIFILIILTIIGALVYRFLQQKKANVKPTLLEPEGL